MSVWRVLVTLHNLVSIPYTACEDPLREFTVEAKQVNTGGGSGLPLHKNPISTFTAGEVTESTPHVFEVRLDKPQRRHGSGADRQVWRCSKDVVDIVVEVREGDRLVGSSTTFRVNVRKLVEDVKLMTRIVGTEMGQVGLSFSVDPSDTAGYRARLESFLRLYNPRGLHLVQSVVDVVPEIDTFTKLYGKYGQRDYDKRLKEFFTIYGPEYSRDIPSLRKLWENREEELMRNLILDNGPELCDVDVNQRLTAFLTQYRLQRSDPTVSQLIRSHAKDPGGLFVALTERYGAEPDPRSYLFPATHYEPSSSLVVAPRHLKADGSPRDSQLKASPTPLRPPPQPTAAPTRQAVVHGHHSNGALKDPESRSYSPLFGTSPRVTPPPESVLTPSQVAPPSAEERRQQQRTGGLPRRAAGLRKPTALAARGDGVYGDAVFDDAAESRDRVPPHPSLPPPTGLQERPQSEEGCSAVGGLSELWLRMKTMLRAAGKTYALHPSFPYYCSEQAFRDLVDSLDAFSKSERESLGGEWRQLCGAALDQVRMDPGSPGFDGALAEVARVASLHPVQLQVTSMTAFFHREQYKHFNARLAVAKDHKTERLVLVGDHQGLLDIAQHGVRSSRGSHSVAEDDSDPVAVFSRTPFAQCTHPMTTCVLVCDVVTGRSHASSPPTRLPHSGTKAFLERYDSSVFCRSGDNVNDAPSIAVYDARQVLPYLLVQCTVDPTLTPCSAHPGKPVEYYVLSESAFVCSRCVVMGQYKGREVLPIEEAATQARGKLAEMQLAADGVGEVMSSFAKQLHEEEAMISTAPRRLEAQREIERIRREAEEQISRIASAMEQQDKAQRDRIQAELQEKEAIQQSAANLSRELAQLQAAASPMAVVQALQRAKHDRTLETLIARARARLPEAPLGEVHPLFRGYDEGPRRQAAVKQIQPQPAARSAGSSFPDPTPGNNPMRSTINHDSSSSAYVETPPKLPPAKTRHAFLPGATSLPGPGEDLYSTYQSLSPGIDAKETLRTRRPPTPHQLRQRERSAPACSLMAGRGNAAKSETPKTAGVSLPERGGGKGALAQGWALLHKGDEGGAAAEWRSVKEAFGEDDVVGAKARAYLAEAIDKDYESAARWYTHCLELEPNDRLTAYNYGVLLEVLLQQPHEAIAMYERAAALGDHVAAARAWQLRGVEAGVHAEAT